MLLITNKYQLGQLTLNGKDSIPQSAVLYLQQKNIVITQNCGKLYLLGDIKSINGQEYDLFLLKHHQNTNVFFINNQTKTKHKKPEIKKNNLLDKFIKCFKRPK